MGTEERNAPRRLAPLDGRLFVQNLVEVGPGAAHAAILLPGQYVSASALGSHAALALWDANARVCAIGSFDRSVTSAQTGRLLDETLQLGASLTTLRYSLVAPEPGETLSLVWNALDRRLGAAPLPGGIGTDADRWPANALLGDRVCVVHNGVRDWVGFPAG